MFWLKLLARNILFIDVTLLVFHVFQLVFAVAPTVAK